jgi:predicted unusual protein kinase regulating ubiquinone biosynthesis (AarF/ABC1/UbiB family)
LEDFLIATKKQHRSVAKFLLPTYYIATIQCLGILEGLAIEVDPKARVISAVYPYVTSRVSMGPYVAEKKKKARSQK